MTPIPGNEKPVPKSGSGTREIRFLHEGRTVRPTLATDPFEK
jgi:hypothetical protein